MDDLISRKALLAAYDRVHIGEPGMARKLMEDAPTVDAVEVVYADWINITQLDGKRFVGFCSHCGTEQVVKFPTALKAYHKHCRWCGAKMDGDGNG